MMEERRHLNSPSCIEDVRSAIDIGIVDLTEGRFIEFPNAMGLREHLERLRVAAFMPVDSMKP